jgi:hypothetical protein
LERERSGSLLAQMSLRTDAKRGTSWRGAEHAAAGERRLRVPSAAALAPSLVALMVVVFVLISLWWQDTDQSLPNGDYAKHLEIAFGYYRLLAEGYIGAPFKEYNLYPPLTHLVGAVYSLIVGGPSIIRMVLAENLVFVPLLAFGCYWAGTVVAGRAAGVLATAFALGSPMIISLFHLFMTDGPTAAMVAITVAALLASERFSRTRMSLLAGVLAGIGAYTRATFVLFILGLVLVMVLRGGWRQRKGLALFVVAAVVIAGPWYGLHLHDLYSQTSGAVSAQQPLWYGSHPYPSNGQLLKYTWYGWDLVNQQLYLPLALFFLVGLVTLSVGWLRDRRSGSQIPELLVGGFVGYLGTSLLTLEDPRYTVPAMVYVAVFATAWIVRLKWRRLAVGLGALLVLVVIFNSTEIDKGWPSVNANITLPGREVGSPIGQGTLAVASTSGYFAGQPAPAPARGVMLKFFGRIRGDGAKEVAFDSQSLNSGGYNLDQLYLLATISQLGVAGFDPTVVNSPKTWWVFRSSPASTHVAPCILSFLRDTTGIYTVPGPLTPTSRLRCP